MEAAQTPQTPTQTTETPTTPVDTTPQATPAPETTQATPETPQPETPKEEPAQEETKNPEEEKLASRFAALTRKERAIREKEAALKEQAKRLEEEKAKTQKILEKKAQAKLNPLSWLEEAELTYDELTQYLLNDKKPTADSKFDALQREIAALKKEKEEFAAAQQRAQEQALINEFKGKIAETVKTNDKYELIRTFNYDDVVYNVIDQHAAETGRLMSIQEACDMVEAHLEQQAEEDHKKLLGVKKFQKKQAPKKEEPIVKQGQSSEPKTLSNQTDSPPRLEDVMDPDKRKKLAAQLIRFEA